MASPPVIVNHSVVRAGASVRASAAGLAAYAGTRRGVVIEVSEADGRRLGVDGLAAYAANRTGSTGGLWGADGPIAVAEARRAIAQNGGAVLTTVVTVPNGIAPDAGLDRLDAWQALVRSEWPRLFSEMTGVPESRVEFYAAMHVNGTNHHVHILTVDREGDWDSLLPKGKMEAARLEISSKAMAPLLREAYIERDLAREAALDAVARIDRNRFDIELPPDGRIEAAHLRRFHPEASAALREALDRAASDSPELAGALDRHRKAVESCACLKCLTGEVRDTYVHKAAADLGLRCENAALRVIVPDRTPAREEVPTRRAAPQTGPATERRREAGLATEARACIPMLASIYFSPVSLNRRAVRAKAVSPVALTYFHRFRSRLDGAVPRQVLQPVGPAGYLDQVAVVAHPVRDRARRHVVPEHPAPAADPHVGGDDRRALLVARRYQC